MANRQVLYSATVPIGGSVLKAANNRVQDGMVPYFVSGPLSRKGIGVFGVMGTLLHVAAWVVALIYDIMVGLDIDHDQSPGAWTYWLWGTITLGIGLVGVLGVTGFHFWSWYWKTTTFTIPEGAAAPWMMTLFIGGAQISLILTILQMIASTGSPGSDFFNYPNDTVTVKEQKDYRESQRQLMVISMVMKVYIVQFLKNNQEWAGPADALK